MAAISSTPSSPGLNRLAVPLSVRPAETGVAVVADVRNTLSVLETANPVLHAPASPAEFGKTASKTPAPTVSKEEMARQVHELQAKMDKLNPALAFVVDEESGRALIQLTDRATKEVILQFPTEAALQISKALDQFQKGQLVSRTV